MTRGAPPSLWVVCFISYFIPIVAWFSFVCNVQDSLPGFICFPYFFILTYLCNLHCIPHLTVIYRFYFWLFMVLFVAHSLCPLLSVKWWLCVRVVSLRFLVIFSLLFGCFFNFIPCNNHQANWICSWIVNKFTEHIILNGKNKKSFHKRSRVQKKFRKKNALKFLGQSHYSNGEWLIR